MNIFFQKFNDNDDVDDAKDENVVCGDDDLISIKHNNVLYSDKNGRRKETKKEKSCDYNLI